MIWLRMTIFSLGRILLFCNIKWFYIKAATAYHPIIQKEVDDLLAKDAFEKLTDGTGF